MSFVRPNSNTTLPFSVLFLFSVFCLSFVCLASNATLPFALPPNSFPFCLSHSLCFVCLLCASLVMLHCPLPLCPTTFLFFYLILWFLCLLSVPLVMLHSPLSAFPPNGFFGLSHSLVLMSFVGLTSNTTLPSAIEQHDFPLCLSQSFSLICH